MAKKRSITDVYITALPETSQLAEKIAAALRSVDREAREAGRRWKREIEAGLTGVDVDIDADTNPARREVRKLDDEIEGRSRTVSVEVDSGGLARTAASASSMLAGTMTSSMSRAGTQGASEFATGLTRGLGGGSIGTILMASLVPLATGLAGVAAAATGALGLIPGAAVAAGSAFGSLKIATLGFGEALESVGDPEKFAEALQALAPNAQQAALGIQAMLPAFDQLKNATQDALFAGVAPQLNSLAATYLPIVQNLTTGIAGAFNSAFQQVSTLLQSPEMVRSIEIITQNIATAFQALAPAAAPFAQVLTDIVSVGSGFLPQIADAITSAATGFAEFVSNAKESGQMQEWMAMGLDTLRQLGDLVPPILQAFMSLAPVGVEIMPTLVNAVSGLSNAFVALVPMAPLLQGLPEIFSAIGWAGNVVADVAYAVGGAFDRVTTAVSPVVNALGAVLAPTVQHVSDVFGTAFNAIRTVVETVWSAIQPVINQIRGAIDSMLGPLDEIVGTAGRLLGFGGGAPVTGLLPTAGAGQPALGGLPGAQRERRGLPPIAPAIAALPPVPSGGYSLPMAPRLGSGLLGGSGSARPQSYTWGNPPPSSGSSSSGSLFSDTNLQPNAARLNDLIAQQFPQITEIGGWRANGGGSNDHPSGRALDIMIPNWDTAEGKALGDQINQWLHANADSLGIDSTIWQDFWKPVGGEGHRLFRSGANEGHYNHIHAKVTDALASGMPSAAMSPMSTMYDSMSGYPGASASPMSYSDDKSVRDAQQRVQDRADAVERAEMRYNDIMSKGTSTAVQRKTAEDALTKAKREHKDAIDDLATAEQKAQQKGVTGKGSDSVSNFGSDLVGGILEGLGFDGSLFKDPTQFGLVKLLGDMSHVGTDMLKGLGEKIAGGDGASLAAPGGGGGAGPLGSLLSNIPSPFGDLNIGSPQGLPTPGGVVLPGMGGGSGSVVLPASQFMPGQQKHHGRGGEPGPVSVDNRLDMRGAQFGGEPSAVRQVLLEKQIEKSRSRPMLRNLP